MTYVLTLLCRIAYGWSSLRLSAQPKFIILILRNNLEQRNLLFKPLSSIVLERWENAMSELIEGLTALEKRLAGEQIDLLRAMAKQPEERPLAAEHLSRVSDVHSALEAVRAEITARHTREGVSF